MRRAIASWILTLAAGGCGLLATGAAAEGFTPSNWRLYAPRGAHLPFSGSQQAVCSAPSAGAGHCLIHVLAPSSASPAAQRGVTEVKTPTGLSPSTIKSVYGYSASTAAGTGQTIAIVDAYNDPDAASNLETFSRQYGLPAAAFTQVNQEGGSSLPATESGWDLEISLDIEWAHAIAPGARILLVEAKSASLASTPTTYPTAGARASSPARAPMTPTSPPRVSATSPPPETKAAR
jgi:hypothetical protein